jgi:hypothetical protein
MTIYLTNEEATALSVAKQPNRTAAIMYFLNTLPFYNKDEKELIDLTNTLIEKLRAMSDTQFNGLDLSNAIDIIEPDSEFEV